MNYVISFQLLPKIRAFNQKVKHTFSKQKTYGRIGFLAYSHLLFQNVS
jgi:hypothetical protein